jgi:hypothetical protein
MKNILSLGLVFVIGAAVLAQAAPKRSFPNQKDGSAVAHPFYGGYSSFTEVNATESLFCTGKCLLAGIYRSTGATGTHLEIRDTDVISSSNLNELVMPRAYFGTLESDYVGNNLMSFPVLATKGLSIKLSSVGANEHVTVLYIDLDD